MNKFEKEMVDVLHKLKEEHGVIGVKAEFEAEGSRFNELIRLKEILSKVDLGLYIKIGGCEAVRDILDCEIIGVEGIILSTDTPISDGDAHFPSSMLAITLK